MYLVKVRIQNFKSIVDSDEVKIEKDITILIGKNESGKTNFLKSLEKFAVNSNIEKEDLTAFTHHNIQNNAKENTEVLMKTPVITCFFLVDSHFYQTLKNDSSLIWMNKNIKGLEITKFANNQYHVCGYSSDTFSPDSKCNLIDEDNVKKVIEKLNKKINDLSKYLHQLSEQIKTANNQQNPNQTTSEIFQLLQSVRDTKIDTLDRLNKVKSTLQKIVAIAKTKNIADLQDTFVKDIEDLQEYIRVSNAEKALTITEDNIADEIVNKMLPKFIYFSSVEMIPESVELSQLIQNPTKHKSFLDLLKLAGISIDRLKRTTGIALTKLLEDLSVKISGKINENWKQEEVSAKIRYDGKYLYILIGDKLSSSSSLSERSQGFRWFFSFYTVFKAGSNGEFKDAIVLLDDPGVYLHPSGQRDMIKTLEELSENCQFIIATHSPFLIDKSKLHRVRIVSKGPNGTKVSEKFSGDLDSFEPIRAALGITIGDTFGFHKKTLLVEGLSDFYIINSIMYVQNKTRGETFPFSIFPTGGADKMPYFALITHKEKIFDFLILLDNDPEGRKTKKELIERFSIPKEKIVTLDEITGTSGTDLVIEDLIDFSLLIDVVNRAYKKIFEEKGIEELTPEKIKPQNFSGLRKFFKNAGIGSIDKILLAKTFQDTILEKVKNNSISETNIESLYKLVDVLKKRF